MELLWAAAGCDCKVGLPFSGELSRTVVLRDEVVWHESYGLSASGWVHTAVVRLHGAAAGGGGAAGGLAQVKQVVRAARGELYDRLASGFAHLAPPAQATARELLLRRADKSRDPGLLAGVPLFRRLDGARVDLATLRAAAQGSIRGPSMWPPCGRDSVRVRPASSCSAPASATSCAATSGSQPRRRPQ